MMGQTPSGFYMQQENLDKSAKFVDNQPKGQVRPSLKSLLFLAQINKSKGFKKWKSDSNLDQQKPKPGTEKCRGKNLVRGS